MVKHDKSGKIYAMKTVSKALVAGSSMKARPLAEKQILMMCDSPHIIKLYNTYQDPTELHFLLELCICGDLFGLMKGNDLFGDMPCVQYYSAVVIEALLHLHSKHIVYRDLKPENLLAKPNGKIKLCDMDMAKVVFGMTYTVCGTPEYMAPEIVGQTGHGAAVDWWSLGIFVHELLTGKTPFAAETPWQIFRAARNGIEGHQWHEGIQNDQDTVAFLTNLLQSTPSMRLPMQKNGMVELKAKPIFDGFDWSTVYNPECFQAPFKPPIPIVSDWITRARPMDISVRQSPDYCDDDTGWAADF